MTISISEEAGRYGNISAYRRVGTRTRRCNQGGITHSPLHMGVSRPPSPKGPSFEILPAGIGAIILTLHNCDRCFFYWPDPALTGLYPERGEGGAIGD